MPDKRTLQAAQEDKREGKAPTTKIRDIMSPEVLYCFDDQDLDDVAKNMGDVKVRRMPVVNRDKRLVGIISIGDVACNEDLETAGDAVAQVSQPGGPHSH